MLSRASAWTETEGLEYFSQVDTDASIFEARIKDGLLPPTTAKRRGYPETTVRRQTGLGAIQVVGQYGSDFEAVAVNEFDAKQGPAGGLAPGVDGTGKLNQPVTNFREKSV